MSCCLENADNPQAPEFGKKIKLEHNAGCCGSCGETNCITKSPSPNPLMKIRQKFVREDF